MKIINLKNNPNIRDIGGSYKGVTIKEGMLIRGRTLRNITDEQKAFLVNKCNVRTILDLRSHDEQAEEPVTDIPGTKYLLMPVFERQKVGISHTENEKPDKFKIYRYLPTMDVIYYDMLHGVSLENLGEIIKTIITTKPEDFGVYFHCSEGKDRTGIVAAILLLMLGVSKRDIIKEYLITNKMSNKKAFRYYMRIKYINLDPIFALKVGRIFLAKRKYIRVLFNVIKKEYDDSEQKFFLEGLKLKQEDINSFKEMMIVR